MRPCDSQFVRVKNDLGLLIIHMQAMKKQDKMIESSIAGN
jgi:hypothetical protein